MTESSEITDRAATDVSRILLGTVQFGLPYGRRRDKPLLERGVVEHILDTAWSQGIRAFDTSEEYGDAANRLSAWLSKHGHISQSQIVTKIAVEHCENKGRVEHALRRFAGAESITALTHGAAPGERFRRFVWICRTSGVGAGQSVYTEIEVAESARMGAERIQAPVNVLDTRQLEAARENGIGIDARSIYLQGVLLDSPETAEVRVPSIGKYVLQVRQLARDFGMTPAEALLAGVLRLTRPTDRVVIGVDAADELDVVSRAFAANGDNVKRFLAAVRDLRCQAASEAGLFDPRRWKR